MVYSIYVAALDLAGNEPSMKKVVLNTPDSTPPQWMWGTPVVHCVSDFSAVVLVQLDEPGDLAFAVAPKGQGQPSIDDLFSPPGSNAAFVASGLLEVFDSTGYRFGAWLRLMPGLLARLYNQCHVAMLRLLADR
eukprot:scaffold67407_cov30-Prasinocladus_malaysianus.AAC.1